MLPLGYHYHQIDQNPSDDGTIDKTPSNSPNKLEIPEQHQIPPANFRTHVVEFGSITAAVPTEIIDEEASLTHVIKGSDNPENLPKQAMLNEQQLYRRPVSDVGGTDFTWYAAAELSEEIVTETEDVPGGSGLV